MKGIYVLAAALALVGAVVLGSNTVAAQATPDMSLVQKLAERFNLNQTEVQTVFDEAHAARYTEMLERVESRLDALVSEGKITAEQKELLVAKHQEMHANRPDKEALQNMTAEERKADMDAKRAELEAWAKANGIDSHYLKMGPGFGKMLHKNK